MDASLAALRRMAPWDGPLDSHAPRHTPTSWAPVRVGYPKYLHLSASLFLVTPGIAKDEYVARRTAFAAKLPPGSRTIIPAYCTRYSSLNIL